MTAEKLVDLIKKSCILHIQFSPPEAPRAKAPSMKRFIKRTNWRLSQRAKWVVAIAVIAIVLVSSFALIVYENSKEDLVTPPQNHNATKPTPTPLHQENTGTVTLPPVASGGAPNLLPQPTGSLGAPGVVASSPAMNDTVWKAVAENAWAYFQPGQGVDGQTGLPYAGGTGFEAFTDWDLGAYIQAVIDAEKMGLISTDGTWGSYDRINKVLTFLETRPLNATTNWPFWFYDATNGQGYLTTTTYESNGPNLTDTGKLLVALSNVIAYNSSLTQRVDEIVIDGRSNYASLLPTIESMATSADVYSYYVASGFASFWSQVSYVPNQIAANIAKAQTITTYGITLPQIPLTCEPLLMSIFEVSNPSSTITNLMQQVYLAQEAYFNATGNYAAFSEGTSPYDGYVYEWIVSPNGDLWEITNVSYGILNINPVIFNKAAFGFLALYNTTFARNLVIFLEQSLPTPTNGYYDGVDTAGNLDAGHPGSDTNSLILDAASYFIQNNPEG